MKLCEGKLRFDTRKKFSERVESVTEQAPTAMVTALTLSEFNEHLNDTLCYMV